MLEKFLELLARSAVALETIAEAQKSTPSKNNTAVDDEAANKTSVVEPKPVAKSQGKKANTKVVSKPKAEVEPIETEEDTADDLIDNTPQEKEISREDLLNEVVTAIKPLLTDGKVKEAAASLCKKAGVKRISELDVENLQALKRKIAFWNKQDEEEGLI